MMTNYSLSVVSGDLNKFFSKFTIHNAPIFDQHRVVLQFIFFKQKLHFKTKKCLLSYWVSLYYRNLLKYFKYNEHAIIIMIENYHLMRFNSLT